MSRKAEEDPITPICKPALFAIVAGALTLPACASTGSRDDQNALSAYVQARAAGSFGTPEQAAEIHAAALALAPGDEALAYQTFIQALEAGNGTLALDVARIAQQPDGTKADLRLLLLAEALDKKRWKEVAGHVDAIGRDEAFGFMAPLLRAWVAVGSGKGDPFRLLTGAEANDLTASYAVEHRPLLLLAAGHEEMGAAELKTLTEGLTLRDQRLRIAGAALLAREGHPKAAMELLAGDEAPLAAARRLLESGQTIPGGIGSASDGIAELLVRIAGDLHRQNVTTLGIRFARIASFLAPDSSETWLVVSDLLSSEDKPEAALAALENVGDADPFVENARTARIRLLVAADRREEAVAEAEAAVQAGASSSDWTRLGDLYMEMDRHQQAADAYGQALTLARQEGGEQPEWALHLLRGAAYDEAGKWPEAKAELEAAYRLAPEQAIVLNYLGYAQLERRENIDEAMRLIAEASRLQPDSPEITDSLGWAHFLQGDLSQAIPLLERAVQGQPGDPEINEHLGDAYYKAGRRVEARYAWKAALVYAEGEAAERLRAKIDTGLTPDLASP